MLIIIRNNVDINQNKYKLIKLKNISGQLNNKNNKDGRIIEIGKILL